MMPIDKSENHKKIVAAAKRVGGIYSICKEYNVLHYAGHILSIIVSSN